MVLVIIRERGIIGPHLGWSVDEDAMVKLTEAQVALYYALNDCNVLMCLNGFSVPPHIWCG